MNQAAEVESRPTATQPGRLPHRLRFELIFNAVLLAIGLLLVPAAVFFTGQALLGEYSSDGNGMLSLYASIIQDMGQGRAAAWLLVLSPMLGITLLRVLWLPLRRRRTGDEPAEESSGKL
jgi:hypothetical protein